MKKKLFIILGTLVLSINLLLSFALKDNKEENKEISKALEILSKPDGIQAFTLEGEKTNKEFNDLIKNYILDKITCKNGSIATYNKASNEVSLSNIQMPDYCTMNFRYTIYGKLLADNSTIKTRTDFSTVYTETNTATLFKSTESIVGSTAKDVYYFAGDAKNNWVKFAGFYWRIIRTNYDGSIRLLYSGTSPDTEEGYIGTSAFNTEYNSPKYVGYMYGEDDSSLGGIRVNTKDSTIKAFIDNWYSNNLSSYTKYISKDAVYCNDRKAPNYGASSSFDFYAYTRLNTGNPSYDCEDAKDAFSGNNSEAKLTYPIGLMTADEITFAGGYKYTELVSPYAWYYLNSAGGSITGSTYWQLLSPCTFLDMYSYVWNVAGSVEPGRIISPRVSGFSGIRPVISLKGNLIWESGDGRSSSPYEVEDLPPTLYEKLLADNPTIKTRDDLSEVYTEINTGTLFKSTESIAGSAPETVYYFSGNPTNNWVKLGGFYWRIIRTNHDSSIRLIYHGNSPSSTTAYIGTSVFNTFTNDDPMYVGYMYGTTGSLDNNRLNTNSSTIKTYIENWYKNNLINYSSYISKSAVYCGDRNLAPGYSYTTSSNLMPFIPWSKLYNSASVSYNCTNSKDAFSASNTEAKLTYPIALLTYDEAIFAGFAHGKSSKNYLFSNADGNSSVLNYWWRLLSPDEWNGSKSYTMNISGYESGDYSAEAVGMSGTVDANYVRPVISLSSDTLYSSGDGSPDSPYGIVYN